MLQILNAGKGMVFFFSSILALEPSQPPIQWVPEFFFSGKNRPEPDVDHSPPSKAEVKNKWSYTFCSPCMPSWLGQAQL
jgi:hypothetical protein